MDNAYRPVWLLIALYMAIGIGTIGAASSVWYGLQDAAHNEDILKKNTELLEQINELEEYNREEIENHRVRNETLHSDICRLIWEVIEASSLDEGSIRPCHTTIPLNSTTPR